MAESIKVRKRRLRDLLFIFRLIKASFPHWYRRVPYIFFTTFVAECDNKPAGAVVVPIRGKNGEIGIIAVCERYRKHGVAGALLREALQFLKRRNISCCLTKVRLDNKPAFDLFTKAGFQNYKLLRRPFLGDVYLMKKDI